MAYILQSNIVSPFSNIYFFDWSFSNIYYFLKCLIHRFNDRTLKCMLNYKKMSLLLIILNLIFFINMFYSAI